MKAKKFEYQYHMDTYHSIGPIDYFLNEMGSDGWDNYAVVYNSKINTMIYYFKREIK